MRRSAGHPSRSPEWNTGRHRVSPRGRPVLDSCGRRPDRPKRPAPRHPNVTNGAPSMTRARTLLGLAAASAAVLALAACSSGDSAPTRGEAGGTGDEYGLVKAGTLTVATEGTYRPFSYHEDGSGDLVGYDVEVAGGRRRQARPRDRVPGDPVGRDLRGPRRRPLRRDRATRSRSTPSARSSTSSASRTPSRRASSSSRRATRRSRASTTSPARPPRSRSRATGTSSHRVRARTSRPSRAGRRPSRCSSRAASTRPSTTSSPSSTT